MSSAYNSIESVSDSNSFTSRSKLSFLGSSTDSQQDYEEDVLVFTEPPNKKLYCTCCFRIFRDPVILSCGHTFCRCCIQKRNKETCPMDNMDYSCSPLVPNLTIKEQIGELLIHCQYGVTSPDQGITWHVNPTGCPMTIKVATRENHEQNCDYSSVKCPNSPNCPPLLKKDYQEHVVICEHKRCRFHKHGCMFKGSAAACEEHKALCPYEGIGEFIMNTDRHIAGLQATIRQKDEEIGFLRAMLSTLSQKVEGIESSVEQKLNLVVREQQSISEHLKTDYGICMDNLTELRERVNLSGAMSSFDPHQIFKCKGTFVGHVGPVWCLCVHQDFLFSGSEDKTIKVWEISNSYTCVRTLEGHLEMVLALCVCDNKLFSGSHDCTIMVWDLDTYEPLTSIAAHNNAVCTLAAANSLVFSGSLKVIKVWSTKSYDLCHELVNLEHWVRALVVHQGLLYGGSHQTVKVWNIEDWQCIQELTSSSSVYSLAVTSHYLLAGTTANCIHVWELETYNVVTKLMGHSGPVYALAPLRTQSGSKVFSASYDTSLRVWNMDHLLCTQTLFRHQASVACLSVARGQIFSGSVDGSVKVWN